MLPPHIKEVFYGMLSGEITLDDFADWLHADNDLEQLISADDYFDLISLNFMRSHAAHDLSLLIGKHIDHGEFETRQLLGLLNAAKHKTPKLPCVLISLYHLYCDGYVFLDNLGLKYGLRVVVPWPLANSWEELEVSAQEALLDSFFPELADEIDRVISLITDGTIVLMGKRDSRDRPRYLDLRNNLE